MNPISSTSALPALVFYLMATLATFWAWSLPGEMFYSTRELVFAKGEYWRLISSLFLHGDIAHLLGNFIFFLIFGTLLYNYFGSLVFPIASVLGGLLTNIITLNTMAPNQGLLGASGIVYFMVAVWIGLYMALERRHSRGRRLIRALGVILVQFVPHTYEPQVSYLSHFVGFTLGILFSMIYFWIMKDKLLSHEVWEEISLPPSPLLQDPQ